jgi:RNA polymerase sigma-70 factor (ECF subfamily)
VRRAAQFLELVTAPVAERLSTIADLDAVLTRLVDDARAAWPELTMDEAAFLAHLARRLSPEWTARDRLASVCAADLFLAERCAAGERTAIELLLARLFPKLDGPLARVQSSSAFIDDVKAALRELLLVDKEGAPAKIGEYSGRGALHSFLQVAAMRLAMRATRKLGREIATEDAALVAMQASSDPELALLKESYRGDFKSAFVEAWRSLTSVERNLLRNHYLDGMTTEQVADLHSVHRATAVRWIARARERLFAATQAQLIERLGLARDEIDSLMRLVQSQLTLSLPRFLRHTQL